MSIMLCKGCEEFIDVDNEDFDFGHELCEECWLAMKAEEHELKERARIYENT